MKNFLISLVTIIIIISILSVSYIFGYLNIFDEEKYGILGIFISLILGVLISWFGARTILFIIYY